MIGRPALFATSLLAASLFGAGPALAGESAAVEAGASEFFYGFDEVSLRRDIAEAAYLGGSQTEEPDDSDSGNGIIFLGGGFLGFWYPADEDSALPGDGVADPAESWTDRIQIGMDWRPDLGLSKSSNSRETVRYLAGNKPDRVGLRADLTAMLYDGTDPSRATAWRITGMLGSTSVSLAPGADLAGGVENHDNSGIMWDIGVGWSSGPISLNAGYLTAYTQVDGLTTDMAMLSFGADYAILPGLSLYGELNLVDDPVNFGDERLGTVFIVGTGLSF